MPAMLSGHGRESIAPQGAPTDPTTPPCRSGPCPRCSSDTDGRASRPRALLQTAPHRPVGAGHARDALRARTGKHRAPGRSYRPHHTLCRSGPCPRCSSNTDGKASRPRALLQRPPHRLCRGGPCPRCSSSTDRKASRPRALLQSAPHHPVGAGHARDALRARTGKHRARGRSYRAHQVGDALHRRPQPPDGGDALRAMPARIGNVGGRHAADGIDRQ